jgi:hypothetical protein
MCICKEKIEEARVYVSKVERWILKPCPNCKKKINKFNKKDRPVLRCGMCNHELT